MTYFTEEEQDFRDLSRDDLKAIDAFIDGNGIDTDDDEVMDLDAILRAHEDNPFS